MIPVGYRYAYEIRLTDKPSTTRAFAEELALPKEISVFTSDIAAFQRETDT